MRYECRRRVGRRKELLRKELLLSDRERYVKKHSLLKMTDNGTSLPITIDIVQNPIFLFLAEESNIAWRQAEDVRMNNVVLRDENRVLANDLATARAVVRQLMEEMNELELRYARRGHALQAAFNRSRELRNELNNVRRINRLHSNPMFRRMPPSFERVLQQEESGSETEVAETDDEMLARLGQEESDGENDTLGRNE